jgi:hypothetical protein
VPSGILSGLNVRLGQLKKFGANLQTLAQRGLSKVLLQQIIAAGPDSGAAYARPSSMRPRAAEGHQRTQASDHAATGQFGKDAADAMYDAGANSPARAT